jgi:hypothetical protein
MKIEMSENQLLVVLEILANEIEAVIEDYNDTKEEKTKEYYEHLVELYDGLAINTN